MPAVLLMILNSVTGALTVIPTILQEALAIKALLTAPGSNFTVEIQAVSAGIVQTVTDTEKIISDWNTSHPV